MSPADRWRAAAEVRAHHWGRNTVVYVQATAATHWLERDAAAVFLALRASTQAMTVNEVATALAPGHADDPLDIAMLLLQLRLLGVASNEPSAPR
jgi:hypothetical protein